MQILQIEQDAAVNESNPHIANIGRLVEEMENKIRTTLNGIYFSKTKDIVNSLRSIQPLTESRQQQALQQDLAAALQRRHNKTDNWCLTTQTLYHSTCDSDDWGAFRGATAQHSFIKFNSNLLYSVRIIFLI